MSSSEPFNFGRKIKELKRIHKKGYADLTAGLKISRERLIQLEENEREPNEAERRRFAAFYGLPVEELGLYEGGTPPPATPAPPARPAPGYGNYTPNPGRPAYDNPPSYGGGERQGGYQQERPGYQGGDRQNYQGGGYQERQGGYQERSNFQERPGGYQERQGGGYGGDRDRQGGNYGGGRPSYGGPGGGRPPGGGGRPGYGGPGGGGGRPPGGGGGRPGPSAGGERPAPRPKPADSGEPREPKSGEGKPVMKYTAEQLGDIESAYLRKQRDLRVPLTFTFLNGKEYTGVVTDFTPFTIHIQDVSTGQEVILRKLAMAYYRKADALSEASHPATNGDKPDAGRS